EEELQFHRDRVVEAECGCLRQGPRRHTARVAGEALALRGHEVADRLGPRCTLRLTDRQGLEIRAKEHVALEDPGEAFYGRAVEPFAVANDVREPVDRNRDALHRPEHVDETQIQEADRSLGEALQRALDRLWGGAACGRFSLRRRALLGV